MTDPRIVVIGGGTGSFTLLSELKKLTPNITALVNMADDGGSTGLLRDDLGVLPPGDVRQCLVALSESSQELRNLFNYRFPKDTAFDGHSFGNLFLSATEKMTNDFGEAVKLASEVLHITGSVVPVTLTNCNLMIEVEGKVSEGEYNIAYNVNFDGRHDRPRLWLAPRADLNPVAKAAIKNANLIVIAPGNLYGSLAPALLVDGMKEALEEAEAPVAYVCNLVNKSNQTKDFSVSDYVSELERFLSPGTINYVLYNTDKPSKELLEKYTHDGEFPVIVDEERLKNASYKSIGGHFLAHEGAASNENDNFKHRSFIRHNAETVSKVLMELI